MIVRTIKHDSDEYESMKVLRKEVLLEPIGVPASYINPEKEKTDFLIGAFMEKEIIGCCVLTPINNISIQLRQMAVRTHLHQQGVGRAIIEFAEALAKERGFSVLMMHARDEVLGFYKKCGYEVISERFFEVGIAHYKMKKKL